MEILSLTEQNGIWYVECLCRLHGDGVILQIKIDYAIKHYEFSIVTDLSYHHSAIGKYVKRVYKRVYKTYPYDTNLMKRTQLQSSNLWKYDLNLNTDGYRYHFWLGYTPNFLGSQYLKQYLPIYVRNKLEIKNLYVKFF
jgi:hypothetical protein